MSEKNQEVNILEGGQQESKTQVLRPLRPSSVKSKVKSSQHYPFPLGSYLPTDQCDDDSLTPREGFWARSYCC